jgi:hypothetical protein
MRTKNGRIKANNAMHSNAKTLRLVGTGDGRRYAVTFPCTIDKRHVTDYT